MGVCQPGSGLADALARLADWQRAGRTQSLLSEYEQAEPAPVGDEPPDGVAP